MAAFFRKRSSSRAAGARQVLNLNSMPAESGRRVLPPSPGARMAAARPFRRPAGISSLPSFNWTLCSPDPKSSCASRKVTPHSSATSSAFAALTPGLLYPPAASRRAGASGLKTAMGSLTAPPFRSAGSVKLSLVSSPSCSAKASIRTSPAPTSSGPS